VGRNRHGDGSGTAPPELAARLATTSIAVAGVFRALLGLLAGHFFGKATPGATGH
jgi:hypothetical protein